MKPGNETKRSQLVDKEMDQKNRLYVIGNILGTATNIVHDAMLQHLAKCEPLVCIQANKSFFGAFDDTIDSLVQIPGMTSTPPHPVPAAP
ncbi:hypothetical protein C0991_007792 [Blastosporella zonata]|nr:hypothetical protein C0991_007792 [Blastosporella zonata]